MCSVWIVIGLAVGTALCIVGSGLRPEPRRRVMSDDAALGYRAGLGEDLTTMVMRRSGDGSARRLDLRHKP